MSRLTRNLEVKVPFVSPVPAVAMMLLHAGSQARERQGRTYSSKPKRKRKAKAKAKAPPSMAVRRAGISGTVLRGSVFDIRAPKASRGRGRRR